MRFEGQLRSWNAERGFGFIEPAGGGQEIFLHVSTVPTHFRPPKIGQRFTFEIESSRDGKKRAANVGVPSVLEARRPVRTDRPDLRGRAERPAPWNVASVLAIPVFVAVYIAVATTRSVSLWFAAAYVGLSLVSLLAYAIDKSAAVAGRWRISEQSLLLIGLTGGWPGGLIAQQLLRHKSNKAAFRSAFWGTVVVNVAAFVLFHLDLLPAMRP